MTVFFRIPHRECKAFQWYKSKQNYHFTNSWHVISKHVLLGLAVVRKIMLSILLLLFLLQSASFKPHVEGIVHICIEKLEAR